MQTNKLTNAANLAMNINHIVGDESLVINLILASKILSFSLSNRWTSFATCVFTCELARIGSSDTFDGSLSPFLHVHRSQWVEKVVRDTKRIDPQTQHNDRHNERWRLDQIKSIGSDFKNWSDRLRPYNASARQKDLHHRAPFTWWTIPVDWARSLSHWATRLSRTN